MKPWGVLSLCLVLFSLCAFSAAQQAAPSASSTDIVPHLVQFSGAANLSQNVNSGVVGITIAIYKDQEGGSPLWIETQNAVVDSSGHYEVMLGATKPGGLPMELFASGAARWVGVTLNGGQEQPRVLLLSVPYALKAGDAETVGGLPPSAFVLASPPIAAPVAADAAAVTGSAQFPPPASVTGSGTTSYVPLWTSASALGNSVLFQSGTGSTAKVGVGTTTPATTLDVKGTGTVRGVLTLPATATATSAAGKDSQALSLVASAFNSSTSAAVNEFFNWQAEPTGNNTSAPSASLNLLFGSGPSKPVETGLNIASNGQITFATGQTFPGTGTGTITGVTGGTDLMGGGTSGSVTLNLDTTKVPQLGTANTFTGNQTVNGNVTATNLTATQTVAAGVVNAATSFDIGGTPFAFGSYSGNTAFLGFSGNTATTGISNTAIGFFALRSISSGGYNTASGVGALYANTTGQDNTASGFQALDSNTTGYGNTAVGAQALIANTEGFWNTASGYQALYSNTTGIESMANGFQVLYSNTTGDQNTGSGFSALYYNTTGTYNVAYGGNALGSNTTGSSNTAVGEDALGNNTSGSNLTCVGQSCDTDADGLYNATAIGAHARVGASNSLVLGGTGQYAVKVGIGTGTPSNVLTVAQGAGHPVSDSWETYSSRRWKTNIQTLPNALTKVERLRGVSYDLKDSGKHEIGVIAEEVGAVVPELVSYEPNGKDARSVDYSRLTALLIEATKEQQRELQRQQSLLRTQAAALGTQAEALRTQAAAIHDLKSALRETRQSLQKIKAQVGSSQPALVAGKMSTKSQVR